MKTELKELTLIFTVRIDSPERFDNVMATLRYYCQVTDSPAILLEADSSPRLKAIMNSEFPTIDYIFVKDDEPVFHRTHFINEELRRVKTPLAAIIDSDIIVPTDQLISAYKMLQADDRLIMVLPYDGRAIDHDRYISDIFRRTIDPESLTALHGNRFLMFGFRSVGGAFMVNVDRYKSVGWENEHFPGWGPEDFEREHRLDILGHKPARIKGVIHHLNHSRGINSSNSYNPLILSTKREYCKICSMMPNELRQYIASWPWIH